MYKACIELEKKGTIKALASNPLCPIPHLESFSNPRSDFESLTGNLIQNDEYNRKLLSLKKSENALSESEQIQLLVVLDFTTNTTTGEESGGPVKRIKMIAELNSSNLRIER